MRLNNLEVAILGAIIEDNKHTYPFLEEHFDYLFVLSREFTGVGMYVNFGYTKTFNDKNIETLIASKKSLIMQGFQYELSYILSITKGRIHFLEIVTNEDTLFDNTTNLDNFSLI